MGKTKSGNNQFKPITLEDAKQEFIARGYIPLFKEYKNNSIKLTAKTQEGYKVYTTLGKIKQGKKPYIFGKSNPYTIENIKLWLKLNNSPYRLISTEFKSACNHKLTWFCQKHGKFECNWNSMYGGNGGCYECRNEKIANSKKLSLDEIKDRLKDISPTIEIVSKKYVNSVYPLKCKCLICGHEWETKWGNLSQGQGCVECFIRYQRGINHPRWKGGISSLHERLRNAINEWKKDSFKKYDYRCDITKTNKNLVIHHLYNFSDILEETLQISELPVYQEIGQYTDEEIEKLEDICLELHYKYGLGVCLTEELHKELHSIYGNKNTKEQYIKFKEFKLNSMATKTS